MNTSQLGGRIKSIQRGTISLVNTATTNTATITNVDAAKSILALLGTSCPFTGSGGYFHARLELTNATTITATREVGASGTTLNVSFQVVEYY